jgi:hypothetical protein
MDPLGLLFGGGMLGLGNYPGGGDGTTYEDIPGDDEEYDCDGGCDDGSCAHGFSSP